MEMMLLYQHTGYRCTSGNNTAIFEVTKPGLRKSERLETKVARARFAWIHVLCPRCSFPPPSYSMGWIDVQLEQLAYNCVIYSVAYSLNCFLLYSDAETR
jgi:hypothetical protein